MVLSPLFAFATFILNFSTVQIATQNYSQLLIWLGLRCQINNAKCTPQSLIQNHIFILVVCGMHGYINRFWAGQRLFFKKMNIEQEEKLQQEINRLARRKVQKLKRERKLQTKSSRERLKSFSKQGKYFKRRERASRIWKHCSYRHSDFYDLITLLMSSIESRLSNKPK